MGWWRKLFGRGPQPPRGDAVSPHVAEFIAKLKSGRPPCIRLIPGGTGRSRLGGVPDLAGPWPGMRDAPCAASPNSIWRRSAPQAGQTGCLAMGA